MTEFENEHSLNRLRRELKVWKAHIETLGLSDRLRFIEWLSKSLDPSEIALTIDAEIERRELWKTYLRERYGPCERQERRL